MDDETRVTIVESPLPVKNFEAQFSVTPDDDAVNLVWSATYDAADGSEKDARSLVDGSSNMLSPTSKPSSATRRPGSPKDSTAPGLCLPRE